MKGAYRLELRDRINGFQLLEILDSEYVDLSWAYSRIGGCGECSFLLPRKLFEEKNLSGDYNLRIYRRNHVTNSFDLRYQGLVETKDPSIQGNQENIGISGHGYSVQLNRIYLDEVTYSSTEVSVIVKSLLDTYITPNTDITYDASDIEATGFTVDSIKFNEMCGSAFSKLANIVGSREFGVDQNRKFFFKARNTSVGWRFPLGYKVTDFREQQDFSDVVNRIIVQGGETGGVPYKNTYNDLPSQLKYGIRSKVESNSSVTTDAVASQIATSVFAEFNDVIRKASCSLVGFDGQIEGTNPIPLFVILGKEVKYGEKRYGTFLYSGQVERIVNRVNYVLSNNNTMSVSLDLGQIKPLISEQISQLEFNLEQERSANL